MSGVLYGLLPSRLQLAVILLMTLLLQSCASRQVAATAPQYSALVHDRFVQGLLLAAQGEYSEASDVYRSLLEEHPGVPALHYALAKAQVSLDFLDSARIHTKKAAELDPENKYYGTLLAGIYHEQKAYPEAAREYERLARLDPSDIKLLYMLAQSYLAGGETEKSLGIFLRILEYDPSDELTLSRILWLELKLRHYREAIQILQELIRQGNGNDKLKLTLGELYLQIEQPDKAIAIFQEIIERNTGFLPAWIALLEAAIEKDDPQLFKSFLERFFDLKEIDVERKNELARLFMLRAELDAMYLEPALVMIGSIIDRHPDNTDILLMRGIVLNHLDRHLEARDDFSRVLQAQPMRVQAWEEMASSYMSQDQYHHVLYTVRKARKFFELPSLRMLVMEGYALFRLELYGRAIDVFDEALAYKEQENRSWLLVQLHTTRAMTYEKLLRYDLSKAAYASVLEIDPDNPLALNNLAYMMAEQGEQLDLALEYATKAVEFEPDNPVFLDTLGWVLYKQQKYERAKLYLEKAATLDPSEPEIRLHLDKVLDAMGEGNGSLKRE
ncbi:MAG: tetratricopeptide repeat protein [Prosthecochloris sp.]|nr:tetratricopeptide repeat protein [Prosthecochloris sp.]